MNDERIQELERRVAYLENVLALSITRSVREKDKWTKHGREQERQRVIKELRSYVPELLKEIRDERLIVPLCGGGLSVSSFFEEGSNGKNGKRSD